jgi:electron transport complex protein RnfD
MIHVLIALAPAAVFGVVLFGIPALLNILVSVVAAMAAEALFRAATKQENRVADFSAVVSGLLLALILPPSTPLWMTALGAVFAVIVAKEFFGGLGANVFNPALIGRALLIMSFPSAITTWSRPTGLSGLIGKVAGTVIVPIDGVSAATPLGLIKQGNTIAAVGADFAGAGLAADSDYWSTIKTLFIGNHGGSIGETSVILILVGALYLLVTKTIDWRTPVAMTVTGFLVSLVLGMDPLFAILSGGLLFGAVFMATDYVSTPLTAKGKLIFGCGAGLITVLIRKWGNYPEGVTYGILIMNACAPFLNRLLQRKYGFVPPKKNAPAAGKPKTEGSK